ncbi:MAG: YfcE family phosphodiesterase [Oscillospiraceae bacterium]|nr:YfcE family phosphodiesterase [Oscillospiraceae bacterium]
MIKAAVFSDTHGNNTLMIDAARRCRPDVLIHLGDHDRDALELREEFPDIPLYFVCGNCDLMPLAPAWDIVPLGPVKAFITHGHLYNVSRWQADSLVYAAQEQGCQIAMYGHTHSAVNDQLGGVTLINPGTAGKGRELTWALVTVFDNGAIACEIKDL